MHVEGEFFYLGFQKSKPDAEKEWFSVTLAQKGFSKDFYITDKLIIELFENDTFQVGSLLNCTIKVSVGVKSTFFNLLDVIKVEK